VAYRDWFDKHAQKHKEIVDSLSHLSDKELIEYFDFDNMKVKHPDFCPLYIKDKKCHDMEKLNCYFCSCMHFRFNDDGVKEVDNKTCYSYCSIESKNHRLFESDRAIHNDCSMCKVPHKGHIIDKYFSRDWREVMKNCDERVD
jgi:hypothetical protein